VPPDPIRLITDAIVPRAVESLDLNEVLGEIDFDQVIDRVDLNAVLARVDVDALMDRIDLNAVLARVDLNRVMDRVDVNHLMDEVDLDRVIARVNLTDIIRKVQVDAIMTATASSFGYRLLDLLRRQLLGLDIVVTRLVKKVRRTRIDEPVPKDDSYSGQTAGAVSRLVAFLIDAAVVFLLYSGGFALIFFMASLFVGHTIKASSGGGLWHIIVFVVFALFYQWVGLVVAGRTVGKGLSGLRVTAPDRAPIRPGTATRRVVVYPFSFILGLGLIGIVIGRQHRALHDVAAPSLVVYDWGDRRAQMGPALARLAGIRGPASNDGVYDRKPDERQERPAEAVATPAPVTPTDDPGPVPSGTDNGLVTLETPALPQDRSGPTDDR
jgi:uncharacterized RDD family membrane protein YckC